MSIIPPDPGKTKDLLRAAISDLRQLAELNPEQPAYAEALRHAESALSRLEAATQRT